jgi:hypothetical protein
VTDAERKLLEDTARTVLRLSDDVQVKLAGNQSVLRARYLANGNFQVAIARLRVEREPRELQRRDTAYISSFIESINQAKISET